MDGMVSQHTQSSGPSPSKFATQPKNGFNFKTPHDDEFDPKQFVKRVDTDIVFDSDGEPEAEGKANRNKFSSIRLAPDESLSQQKFLHDGSSLFPEEKPYEIKLTKDQFQTIKPLPQIQTDMSQRKFSGIHEDAYFQFVEDYDNFIGQFTSDDKVKIVRGFLDHNKFNRIYITQMVPTKKASANLLIVHGFGHTVKYLDVVLFVM